MNDYSYSIRSITSQQEVWANRNDLIHAMRKHKQYIIDQLPSSVTKDALEFLINKIVDDLIKMK